MSVNVLSYTEWLKTQSNIENVSNYDRLELYEKYCNEQTNTALQQGLAGGADDAGKGVTVQPGGMKGTSEDQTKRADANAAQVAEIAALKGESAEFIQQAVTDSGKDKRFSDNKKAQNAVEEQIYRELIARDAANPESDLAKLNKRWREAKTDVEKQAILQEKEAVFAAIRKEAELRTEALRMNDEIKGMNDYAKTHKKDEVGIGDNLTLTANDEIDPDKGTLYADNENNLRDQILQEYMNVDTIPTLNELTQKYGDENIAKAVLGVLVDNEYRKTHYEVHDAYLDKDAYEKAKEEAIKSGVSEATFKEHNTLVENKNVKAYIQENFTNEKGEVDMQKLKDFVFQYIGTDFEVNYGVHKKHNGGYGQDEYRQLMNETGLTKAEVQKLVVAAGGFTEKSDKATKILLAGLEGALIGAGLGAGGGAIAGSLLQVTANATATAIANATANVVDASGNIIQSATASDVQTATASKSANAAGVAVLPGALTGAAIGAVIGMGSAAIFYHYDGQRDVMNGFEVAQAVGNPENMLEGLKNPTDLDKVPYNMITSLKELGIPDVEIVNAIKVAKGNATGTHVTIEELISACRMLEVKYSKGPEKGQEETVVVTPSVVVDPYQDVKQPVYEDLFKYDLISGEHWSGIAQEMYLCDGKPITPTEAYQIGTYYKRERYGYKASDANMPGTLMLLRTLELNGKTYTLKEEGWKRNPDSRSSNGRRVTVDYTPRLLEEGYEKYGYKATVTGTQSGNDVNYDSGLIYTDATTRDGAMRKAEAEYKSNNPAYRKPKE